MHPSGFSLLDIVFTMAALSLTFAIAIPQTMTAVDRARGLAAARYLASRMALSRAQAVARATTIALRFEGERGGVRIGVFQDGNRNGVRSRDIDLLIDRQIEETVALTELFPGVDIATTPGMPGLDAVQLGGSSLLSFTARGTATSGSIYVKGRDGTQWVVRVLGVTGRCRVLRYIAATGEWVNAS